MSALPDVNRDPSAVGVTSVQQRLRVVINAARDLRSAIRALPPSHAARPMLYRGFECLFDDIIDLARQLNLPPPARSVSTDNSVTI